MCVTKTTAGVMTFTMMFTEEPALDPRLRCWSSGPPSPGDPHQLWPVTSQMEAGTHFHSDRHSKFRCVLINFGA